jgi:hypothetical protein
LKKQARVAKPFIENSLFKAGLELSFQEFQISAATAAKGCPTECRKFCELVKQLFPHVPKARGRPLATITVAHMLLLYAARSIGRGGAYTYCPSEEDFVDDLTLATRRQFAKPDFNPRESRRLYLRLAWDQD